MVKKTPNVLEDLLFHTADPASGRTRVDGQPASWRAPAWDDGEAITAVDEPEDGLVPIHASRWPALRRYAERRSLSLRDAVDQAIALLLEDDPAP
jgi:hypothetical protein